MDKQKLNALHHKIYLYTKKKALSFEMKAAPELQQYRDDQEKFSKRKFKASNTTELLKSLLQSQIIYLGDFHTFDQSSRNVLRVLRSLLDKSRDQAIYLGMELIHSKHQRFIEAYLEHQITELEFLEMINYSESWRFPWTHYKPIFDLAKEFELKIIGLNSHGSLKKRDEFCADIISKQIEKATDAKFIVMFGEYHIVPNKIPLLVHKKLEDPDIKITIIHQNLDEVYWKQVSKGLKKSKIIKYNDDEFSLQNSLPWIKYESMIYWYENLDEDPEFDLHNYIIEQGVMAFGEDVYENFDRICTEVVNVFGLDIEQSDYDSFNLYDHTKVAYISNLIDNANPKLKGFYKYQLETNRIFGFFHQLGYYCPNYSVNRLTYIAGLHIYHCMKKLQGRKLDQEIIYGNSIDRFFIFFNSWFMAYWTSKIFNPHRKTDLYLDYQMKLLDKKIDNDQKKLIQSFLKILNFSNKLESIVKNKRLLFLNRLAQMMAHFFADNLFHEIHKKEKAISISDVQRIFLYEAFDLKSFKKLKKDLFKGKVYQHKRKRML